ncbi:MAG: DUF4872 domain-containing protein [Gemmataceae bacterium]
MTAHKHLKKLVRARMTKTGESYATARRHVLRDTPKPPTDPTLRWHFPGNVPATTALRVLLAHAGVRAPHTGQPFTEAMLFGIAGGVGIGVFSFLYEKEDFASFFVAGRHSWQDDVAYLKSACERFGIAPVVRESGGAKLAERHLTECLAAGPCVAWVDSTHLPHRAMPIQWSGGGYHVITVYRIDAEAATIGDLTDDPIAIPLADLATARARIKKQKNRLLSVPKAPPCPDLLSLVRDGLQACHDGLTKCKGNFNLTAIRTWAERMHGSKTKDAWERVFAPGHRFWTGLTAIHSYVDHYFSGGGLCRPLFADFLTEAADALKRPTLTALAKRYADLGDAWSELADVALPDRVPAMKEAKELYNRRSELLHAGAPADEVRAVWTRLGELGAAARAKFPLNDIECAELRADLQRRLHALYEGELAAAAALNVTLQSL